MYGSPYATYTISGHVTNESDVVLRGIEVSVGDYYYIDSLGNKCVDFVYSARSDGRGGYLIDNMHFESYKLIVVAKDIDGEQGGGEFESDTLVVRDFKYKDEGLWYSGHADIDEINFILKKK